MPPVLSALGSPNWKNPTPSIPPTTAPNAPNTTRSKVCPSCSEGSFTSIFIVRPTIAPRAIQTPIPIQFSMSHPAVFKVPASSDLQPACDSLNLDRENLLAPLRLYYPVPEPMSAIVHPLLEGLQTRVESVIWECVLGWGRTVA